MSTTTPQVLVVAKNIAGITHLVEHLVRLGCTCHAVTSCGEARRLIETGTIDLMLSEVSLSDGSAYRLIPLLLGSRTTLFFTIPLHHGCLWLPAVDRGQHCFGNAALPPSEFTRLLCEILRERAPIPLGESSRPARPARQDDQRPIDGQAEDLAGVYHPAHSGQARARRHFLARAGAEEAP